MKQLGISEHTDEDCRVSDVLTSVMDRPAFAEDLSVWIRVQPRDWRRYHLTEQTRQRILEGDREKINLEPWEDEYDPDAEWDAILAREHKRTPLWTYPILLVASIILALVFVGTALFLWALVFGGFCITGWCIKP